ncbi:DUF6492 family protein [Phocaeicola sp.]
MHHYIRRGIIELYSFIWLPQITPSKQPIDVVIPIISKDLKILPLCLQGIYRNVRNKIRDIYIVAPHNEEIIQFCQEQNLLFIDEVSVLGFSPHDLNLIIRSADGRVGNRSGWLFQQFLKLSGNIGTCDHYLCIDADHILIRPLTFLDEQNRPVFYLSKEHHEAYYDNIERLMGYRINPLLSHVAHKMLFSHKDIDLLHTNIEKRFKNKKWWEAIIDCYDKSNFAGFSEFELYGDFVTRKRHRPWKDLSMPYSKIEDFESLVKKYSYRYNSVTFPEYFNE